MEYKKSNMIFLDKKEVEEKDAKTGLGVMKHWHTYSIIAKKK